MRNLIPFFLLFTACNVQQQQKETSTQKKDQWSYEASTSVMIVHGNYCEITIKAVPESHELIYTIDYKGKGYLEPLKLSTIDSRPSATLVAERVWIEKDTLITKKIRPQNNTLKYAQINDKGPLRGNYKLSYLEEGQLQHIRFQLKPKVYNYYLENFPYAINKKSYHLSPKNLVLEENINVHIQEKLKSKREIKGAESMVISENQLNVAGLISHVNCIYDGQRLILEVTWINHTELDLWLTSPSSSLSIDKRKVPVTWSSFEHKVGLGKGKRISVTTEIEVDKAPNEITLPINNVLFFDEDVFFPEGMEIVLDGNLSL
ncbi:hypothetical protein [Flammeovirga sp. SJP92]|uniref:hypothetical protein n=1 Tax=Flammeovirga sp. SJP92 TaxID=1775430 RepID=UPI000788E47D|nr:hypothetical protein [Flammeovirga sp. SJP92]KXX68070.1 hypothetical protein AVL50_23640 [Flammeovirga sp. SJP92]